MRLLRFWKPYNVLTQFTDAHKRPTLADFIDVPGVYAAGRLDRDSEGLLLLTDNGSLNARLTQPQFHHPRTYWALVEGSEVGDCPSEAALDRLRQGVPLAEGEGANKHLRLTLPTRVRLLPAPPQVNGAPFETRTDAPIVAYRLARATWLELTLTEGRNRQVRRMTAAIGYPTLRLVRAQVGAEEAAITLEGLQPGQWEDVPPTQAEALVRALC